MRKIQVSKVSLIEDFLNVIVNVDRLSVSPCEGRRKGVRYCAGALVVHSALERLGRRSLARRFVARLQRSRSSREIVKEAERNQLAQLLVGQIIGANDRYPAVVRRIKCFEAVSRLSRIVSPRLGTRSI